MQEAGIHFALQTSRKWTWVFLRVNCVAFELSNKRALNRPIRPAGGSKSFRMSSIHIMSSTRIKNFPHRVAKLLEQKPNMPASRK